MEIVAGVESQENGKKRKTTLQIESLEQFYAAERCPSRAAMKDYATTLNLSYKQINEWFYRRRRKEENENDFCCSSGSSFPNNNKIRVTLQNRAHNFENKRQKARFLDYGGFQGNGYQHNHSDKGVESSYTNGKFRKRPSQQPASEYMLQNPYRDDGPPLGSEFDPLPSSGVFTQKASENNLGPSHHMHQTSGKVPKERKVCLNDMSAVTKSQTHQQKNAPVKRYGIGKGLMTLWRMSNSARTLPVIEDIHLASTANKQRRLIKKSHKKRRPAIQRRKDSCNWEKDIHWEMDSTPCELAIEGSEVLKKFSNPLLFMDDEELELRESQVDSNSLTCSVHLTSHGRNGCTLCKDLLGRFPPLSVKMRCPLASRPWDSSPEMVKKLFKVFRFLYSHADIIDTPPFTLDEFAQAFHHKDSLLLGEIHISVINLLLTNVEDQLGNGTLSLASKDCQYYAFLQFVKQQEFVVMHWKKCLNPLSWPEILRQVMLAAGYGSNKSSLLQARKDNFKERNQLLKLGLHRGTLKGKLFCILQEQGISGMKVSELVKAIQIMEMDLPESAHELEQLIYSALSSDITLFEKISASAFRIRLNPATQAAEQLDSDDEDSGAVENNSVDSEADGNTDSDDLEELDSATGGNVVVGDVFESRNTGNTIIYGSEIDESQPGEAWMLGLVEGGHGDLTIEEKLDALVALVDLANGGSSIRTESLVRDRLKGPPSTWLQVSGAKIKKPYQHPRTNPFENRCNMTSTVQVHSSQKHCQDLEFSGSSSSDKLKIKQGKMAERYGIIKHWMKSVYLGSDRRYNSYWIFLGPCHAKDPGHRRVYFESSEDGHWEVIDTGKGLDALLSSLDSRGAREAQLLASLEKRHTSLFKAMSNGLSVEDENKLCNLNWSATDVNNGSGSSPISDVDNNLEVTCSFDGGNGLSASCARAYNVRKSCNQKNEAWDRHRSFDAWVWKNFYYKLGSLKYKGRTDLGSLARCERCNDLYWRDEKHCIICHTTFELDFDIEERYVVHVATCRGIDDGGIFHHHKVLSSELQSLKAATYAIEAVMPDKALVNAWSKSGHALWVKRLRRASSLPELLQVLTDFVGAINEEWLCQFGLILGSHTAFDEIVLFFDSIPRTVSAVALWLVKLDYLVTCYMKQVQTQKPPGSNQQLKGKRAYTQ